MVDSPDSNRGTLPEVTVVDSLDSNWGILSEVTVVDSLDSNWGILSKVSEWWTLWIPGAYGHLESHRGLL